MGHWTVVECFTDYTLQRKGEIKRMNIYTSNI